ncbi:DNA cytosine methyltransferase [Mesorhizobium sp.]|uniref:DNA cytosine methyltransferase n=1 Tax=Mesorhizobium sp. TaxID=1871066 RepID=UPI000FE6A5D7|nr:DNA cytosine methyltransferase [Mesorhizobium sp.]RWH94905.1 MAG: DNA cytosine methyltransferase [Mesorhizobium sp.]RWK49762.1 MAG: DNA cytosine methyltransferase [Mesorhizobium sp.]TIP88864.1 MAG: DNA cytosine methyltransferase [Mesorhizobium sp.]TJW53761.1 MAG: DNA cytosine methyltransferase [Mesorhizobium sp.]
MSNQTVASLFSGIGGFEVGFAKAGLKTSLMCEKDSAAQAVLRSRFPEISLVDDVTAMPRLPKCDALVGGWPCQDLSQAGRMAGLDGSQSGLVSHVFRLLDATPKKPNTIVLENVAFSLNLQKGKAVRYVTAELAERGYRWAYRVLDTREFGLPHRRRRIFIVGMLEGDPGNLLFDGIDRVAPASDWAANIGFYWTEGNRGVGWTPDAVPPLKGGSGLSIPSPPAIWTVESGLFQTPGIEDAERLQGFPAGWTAAARDTNKGERGRWRLVGNAVSVPVATWVGQRLVASEAHSLAYQEHGTETLSQHNAAWGGPKQTSRYIPGAGEGPADERRVSIASFGLNDAQTLSVRAAEGFLRRYMKSGLTKNQDFAQALATHCGLEEVPA